MGNYMTILYIGLAVFIGIVIISTVLWITSSIYLVNRRDKVRLCSCGKKPPLHWKEADNKSPKQYAYICSCGVQGYMGLNEEEAFYGWMMRGNREGYMAYITAKHGK